MPEPHGTGSANAPHAGAGATVAGFKTLRASMAKWVLDPASLAFSVGVGVNSYYDIVDDPAVASVDKFGPKATILNGQLGSVYGVPIVVSEHVLEDLNASGVHDGVTTNLTYTLTVNRNEWAMGQRMALDIEVDESIYRESFQRVMVGFMRETSKTSATPPATTTPPRPSTSPRSG